MKAWIGDGCTGRLVGPDAAVVSVMDHGFTVGDGVFETLKVTADGPFAMRRHLERLVASAAALDLAAPDVQHIRHACEQVVHANRDDVGALARLRITWTSGSAPLGSDRVDADPTLVIAMMRQQPWPEATSAITIPQVRNPRSLLAGAKSTSYGENVLALTRAHAQGASEAILGTTDGHLCEGTGTNVFVIVDGAIWTPRLDSGCLAGITRALVLQTSVVEEVEVGESVLRECDGAAVLSSTRDVHPVSHVRLSDGSARELGFDDPLIREAAAALAALYAQTLNP